MKFQGSLGRSDTESLNAGVIYEYHSSKYNKVQSTKYKVLHREGRRLHIDVTVK